MKLIGKKLPILNFRWIKEEQLPEPDSTVVDKAINAGHRRVSCIEIIISINKIDSNGKLFKTKTFRYRISVWKD